MYVSTQRRGSVCGGLFALPDHPVIIMPPPRWALNFDSTLTLTRKRKKNNIIIVLYLVLGKFNSFFFTVKEGIQPDTVPAQNSRDIFPTLEQDERKSQHCDSIKTS